MTHRRKMAVLKLDESDDSSVEMIDVEGVEEGIQSLPAGIRATNISMISAPDPDRYLLNQWVEHVKLLSQPEKCDLVIQVADGQFHAHSSVLASVSSFVRDILGEECTCGESQQRFLIFPDLKVQETTAIIDLIYTGRSDVPVSALEKTKAALDLFEMNQVDLKKKTTGGVWLSLKSSSSSRRSRWTDDTARKPKAKPQQPPAENRSSNIKASRAVELQRSTASASQAMIPQHSAAPKSQTMELQRNTATNSQAMNEKAGPSRALSIVPLRDIQQVQPHQEPNRSQPSATISSSDYALQDLRRHASGDGQGVAPGDSVSSAFAAPTPRFPDMPGSSMYPVQGASPYPMPGGSMYPMPGGSPYPMPGGNMYPGSPYPMLGGSMYPGSPYPMPGGSLYPTPGMNPWMYNPYMFHSHNYYIYQQYLNQASYNQTQATDLRMTEGRTVFSPQVVREEQPDNNERVDQHQAEPLDEAAGQLGCEEIKEVEDMFDREELTGVRDINATNHRQPREEDSQNDNTDNNEDVGYLQREEGYVHHKEEQHDAEPLHGDGGDGADVGDGADGGVEEYHCSYCDAEFSSLYKYKHHYFYKHCYKKVASLFPKDKRDCPECGKKFSTRRMFLKHYEMKHNEALKLMLKKKESKTGSKWIVQKKYTLGSKTASPTAKKKLQVDFSSPKPVNVGSQEDDRNFTCCSATMGYKDFLVHCVRHHARRQLHADLMPEFIERKGNCGLCEKNFNNIWSYSDHVGVMHQKVVKYIINEKRFKEYRRLLSSLSQGNLEDHNTLTDLPQAPASVDKSAERDLACPDCGRREVSRSLVLRHLVDAHYYSKLKEHLSDDFLEGNVCGCASNISTLRLYVRHYAVNHNVLSKFASPQVKQFLQDTKKFGKPTRGQTSLPQEFWSCKKQDNSQLLPTTSTPKQENSKEGKTKASRAALFQCKVCFSKKPGYKAFLSHLANSHYRHNLKKEFGFPSITSQDNFPCPRCDEEIKPANYYAHIGSKHEEVLKYAPWFNPKDKEVGNCTKDDPQSNLSLVNVDEVDNLLDNTLSADDSQDDDGIQN